MAYTFTQEQLEDLCREWQERLRLQDWRVRIAISRQWEFENHEREGECDWQLDKKRAVIRILDPVDYPPNLVVPQDQEKTLVHELLHLHGAPLGLPQDTAREIALENFIEFTAQALVELKRQGKQVMQDGPADQP